MLYDMDEQALRKEIMRLTLLLSETQEKHRRELKAQKEDAAKAAAKAEAYLDRAVADIGEAVTILDRIRSI